MKTTRNVSVLMLLLVVAPGLCFAEMLLDDVCKERAKPRMGSGRAERP